MVIILILMNVFVAILNDAYSDAAEEADSKSCCSARAE